MEYIIKHIVQSRLTLKAAWEGITPRIANKCRALGKPVEADTLQKTIAEPNGIKRICILESFKIFFAATFLAMRERGEIIFADIVQFRLLLVGTQFPAATDEERFLRANGIWTEMLAAFMKRDFAEFDRLKAKFLGVLVAIRPQFELQTA